MQQPGIPIWVAALYGNTKPLRRAARHDGFFPVNLEMTQRELAEAVNVGVPHISKVEAGRENPSDDLLRRLAKVFKAEADELFLVARRLPDTMIEDLAADPAEALAFLRRWSENKGTDAT